MFSDEDCVSPKPQEAGRTEKMFIIRKIYEKIKVGKNLGTDEITDVIKKNVNHQNL